MPPDPPLGKASFQTPGFYQCTHESGQCIGNEVVVRWTSFTFIFKDESDVPADNMNYLATLAELEVG